MDEQQEKDFYDQQKNLPPRNPTYTPIWSSVIGSSGSKYAKWFARILLLLLLTPIVGLVLVLGISLLKDYSKSRPPAPISNVVEGDLSQPKGLDSADTHALNAEIAELTELIEINPQDALAYYNRGVVKFELKDYQGAIADYTKAIEIDPMDAITYSNRCGAKLNLGNNKGAIDDCNKALEIDPKIAIAYNNRGIAKRKFGDNIGECADYKKAVSLGDQETAQWLNSADGSWCRNMQ